MRRGPRPEASGCGSGRRSADGQAGDHGAGGGENYTLTSSDDPDYVRRVAAYVDRRLSETAAATNLPSGQGAVLTCFQLTDELMKAQDENRMLRRQMERAGLAAKPSSGINGQC